MRVIFSPLVVCSKVSICPWPRTRQPDVCSRSPVSAAVTDVSTAMIEPLDRAGVEF
ncbi:hypothetical protein [Chelatococcus reniformis]|uniref:hypothetical protein n=1 Tax=Chelatococcus reniformis TaxID=1494448 RepID=UPI001662E497|nr:hypothetical protein [Chelatococcus reniformis]